MKILNRAQIQDLLCGLPLLELIEQGFISYSRGLANIPPVAELLLEKGEVHIKYGAIQGDNYYLVKIASGFYGNAKLGLSTSNGLMLLFSQETGEVVCSLYDEGLLTDIRTAVAGAIAAKYLAPKKIEAIGIIGGGIQARLQAIYLVQVTDCRTLVVWARNDAALATYEKDMNKHGFQVRRAESASALCAIANLIVTTTPAREPLLSAADIRPGTHITAVGSDTETKQELSETILGRADRVVVDSFSQSEHRGEVFKAEQKGVRVRDRLEELGKIIDDGASRCNSSDITVADLTGLAVQDIKIAEAIYLASLNQVIK